MSTMFTMTLRKSTGNSVLYYRSMAPDAMDYTIHHKYKKEELGLPETIMGYKRADGSFGIGTRWW